MSNLFTILPQISNPNIYDDWASSLTGNLNLTPTQSSVGFEKTVNKSGVDTLAKKIYSMAEPIPTLVQTAKTIKAKGITSFAKQRLGEIKTSLSTLDTESKRWSELWAKNKQGTITPAEKQELSVLDRKQLAQSTNLVMGFIGGLKGVEKGVTPLSPLAEKSIKSPISEIPKVGERIKERGFVASVKEAMPEVKVAGQYIPRTTDSLAVKAANLVKSDLNAAEKMAILGTDDKAVATGVELLKKYNAEGQYVKAAELAHTMASNLTEAGKTVQAASILGRLTPEGQLKFAANEINAYNEAVVKSKGGLFGLKKTIPNLTETQSKEILTESKRIFDMPDGEEKAIAFKNLQNKISDLVPSPLYQKIISVWKSGLLTGVKTTGLNEFSNAFHGNTEIIKDIPAAAVDSVASLFTGKRTLAFTIKGTIEGTKEGFSKGWRYLKTGYDERNIGAKLDYKRVNFGTSKIAKGLQKYEETVFHIMGAEDQPFYYGAKARSLQSQAIAQAKNAGLKGIEATSFVNKLVQSPTDEMLKYAVKDAEVSVFQNRTLLGDVAKKIQQIPGGEVVVPFGRTPAAVATQMINYSPVGIVKTIVENIGKGKFDQRLFAQGLGRGITGTGVMYIGMQLAKKGWITLGYPTDDKTRKQWELEGKKENSFYDPIGKKWRNVNIFGPPGNVLSMGAYLQKGLEDTGSFTQGSIQALAGAVSSIKDQTFLQGLNSFVQAINDPQGYAIGLLSSLEGSVIPTIAGDISTATDITQRNTSIKKAGWLGPLQAKIPGLRQTLQPKIDVMGKQIPRAGNIIETLIDPSRPLNIRSTTVVEELKRLASVGQLATPTTYADEKQFINTLTKEQITQLQQRAGTILESKLKNLFSLSDYKKLSDEDKKKLIENFTSKARLVARTEMVLELTQGLSGDALKNKLSELKKSGFLTKEVFNEFTKMR